MKNILFFIESLSGGGAEKVLVTLLKHIDYTKYRITLLTLVDTGILKNEIDFSGINYLTVIKETSNPILKFWYKVKYKLLYQYLPARLVNKWIIPQNGIDTYIAFTEGYCTKILAHTPKNKVAWVHIDLKALPWTINEHIYANIEEEIVAYQQFDKVICVSNSVKEVMEREYGLTDVETIYNPIDTASILELSKEACNLEIFKGFNMVSVGRLTYQKGYDLLIPIISKLIKKGLNIHLYLLGDGSEKKAFEQIIQKEQISNHIHLLGYIKNPYPIMKQMDLFVCSSRSEGYSLVIAEAITLGLPIVSMNCSGPNELLDDGKYGTLCYSYEELQDAIENAIQDNDYYKDIKEQASERKEFFNIKNTMKQIDYLLQNV